MDHIAANDSSTTITASRATLPFELQWEIIEYIILNVFTADDPLPWGQAAGRLLATNHGLSDRLLMPLLKLHRALYWKREALWLDYEAGDEACSTKRTYLLDREFAIFTVIEIMGAKENWAFLHEADRRLTGYTFHVERCIVDQVTDAAGEHQSGSQLEPDATLLRADRGRPSLN